mgnify:CR=1 FL=1
MLLDWPTADANTPRQKRRRNRDDDERGPSPELDDKLKDATTLYVGNLSFYTTEEQIHELFSKYVVRLVACTRPAPRKDDTTFVNPSSLRCTCCT